MYSTAGLGTIALRGSGMQFFWMLPPAPIPSLIHFLLFMFVAKQHSTTNGAELSNEVITALSTYIIVQRFQG